MPAETDPPILLKALRMKRRKIFMNRINLKKEIMGLKRRGKRFNMD